MKPKILIQLDPDPQPSTFDAIVALDSGVDHLIPLGGVQPDQVRNLVYGALFTRGPEELHRTAIFVGGQDVEAAEALFQAVRETYFGPFQVSALLDPNGGNTTAAAAVLAAKRGMGGSLAGVKAAVLAATGPVGRRVARLLSRAGAEVVVTSRSQDRAEAVARAAQTPDGGPIRPLAAKDPEALANGLADFQVLISAGALGVTLLSRAAWTRLKDLKVAIDLNAVPPPGLEGIEAGDRDVERNGVRTWGAIGVGGTKMIIHSKAIETLFEANHHVLDVDEVFQLGERLGL